jgi:hypothetical protein
VPGRAAALEQRCESVFLIQLNFLECYCILTLFIGSYCCTLFPKYFKFFPVDMNEEQYLSHMSYPEHAIKELETKCAVYSVVTMCQAVFNSRISSPTPCFLWIKNYVLFLTICNLYIHVRVHVFLLLSIYSYCSSTYS